MPLDFIQFDNQKIRYEITYHNEQDTLKIKITFPDAFFLQNEKRLDILKAMILLDHSAAIKTIKAWIMHNDHAVEEVECIFNVSMRFDSFSSGSDLNRATFFYNGINLNLPDTNTAVQEHMGAGKPFGVNG